MFAVHRSSLSSSFDTNTSYIVIAFCDVTTRNKIILFNLCANMATIVRRASLLLQLIYNFARYSVLQQAGDWLQSRVQRKTRVVEFRPRQSADEDGFLDIGTTEVDCHLGATNKGKSRRRSSYVFDKRKRKTGKKQKKRRIQVTPSETRAVWEEPSTSETAGRKLSQESNPSVQVNGTRSKRESRKRDFKHKVNPHNNDDQILSQRSQPGCGLFSKYDDNAQLQEVEMGSSIVPTSSRGSSSETNKDSDQYFTDTTMTINHGEDPLFRGAGEVSSSGGDGGGGGGGRKGKRNMSFFSSMICFKGKRSRNKTGACSRSEKGENKHSGSVEHNADSWKMNTSQEGSSNTKNKAAIPSTSDWASAISENDTNHARKHNGQEKSSKEDGKDQGGKSAFFKLVKRKREKLNGSKDQERKGGKNKRCWKLRFRRKQKRSQVEELAGYHSYCHGSKPVFDGQRKIPPSAEDSELNDNCQSLDPCSIHEAPPTDGMPVNYLALDLGDVDAWQNSINEAKKRSSLSRFLSKFKRQRNTKVEEINI